MDRIAMRECGDCQLCCKLLPVPPLNKGAGERCQHQKFGKGCAVYRKPGMPLDCALWNCRWLVNDDTAELSRPDRSHVVIDIMPDFISIRNDDSGEIQKIQVAQVWIDPKYPDAHRDPALRAWVARRAAQGIATMVRFNAKDAITIFAPPLTPDDAWHEITGNCEPEHSVESVAQALGVNVKPKMTD